MAGWFSFEESGATADDLDFLLSLDRVFPMERGRQEYQIWENYYTPDLMASVREKDWPLFNIFPEFDF